MARPDRTGEAIALLAEVAAEFGVDVATIRDKAPPATAKRYVKIRRVYCQRGRERKLSCIEMGIALNRDHTTVTYHANNETRARRIALYHAMDPVKRTVERRRRRWRDNQKKARAAERSA